MPRLITQVHCGYSGWLPPVGNNVPCGEINRKYAIQAFKCKSSEENLTIRCRGWNKEIGWLEEVKDGSLCGTTGRALPLHGLKISCDLPGYSIAYRVFLDEGWGEWHMDGEEIIADKGFYAIQIQLLARNDHNESLAAAHLDELGQLYGTDKTSQGHDYLNFYEQYFGPYRNDSFILAEVGIFNGASLKMWEDFFPNASIVAFDIVPKKNEYKHTTIVCGDASDSFLLTEALSSKRPFIFIEDGSHRYSHQIATFETAFSLLQPGGFYVCEDIQTSFGAYRQQGYNDQEPDAITYFSQLAYLVANSSQPDHPYLEGISRNLVNISGYIDYIIFRKDCVLIRKKLYITNSL